MKQTAEHEITVRMRYPQEDWAVLVSDMLNRRSVAKEGRIINVSSERLTAMQNDGMRIKTSRYKSNTHFLDELYFWRI